MIRQRLRTNLIALLAISLTLTFVQTPLTPAVAAVCQGEAAYPPDLPDCLDPVVAAQQEAAAAAAAKAAADKLAADNAAADRAAAAAVVAAADRAAAELAAAKARADQAAAAELAEKIRLGNLEAAAEVARKANEKAIQDAIDAKDAADRAEAIRKTKEGEELAARQKLEDAQKAFDREQAGLAKTIADKKKEADDLQVIALAKKKLADDAAKKFAEERIVLDQKLAEAIAERMAAQTAANASVALETNALTAYRAAGGVALRVQNDQVSSQSIISKQELLTPSKTFSNLKIQSEIPSVFIADELAALRSAYLSAKDKADKDRTTASNADAAAAVADAALKAKQLIADTARNEFIAAANAKTAATNAAKAAAAELTRLENAIKAEQAAVLAKEAEVAAAKIEEDKKAAVLEVANSAKASTASARTALVSAITGGGDAVSLAAAALVSIRSVATASITASNAAADAAAASERDSAAQATAIRLREEAEAAARLSARNPSYSGPSVNSLELAAAQAEKEAKETERKAKEAKEAEEKALAEKKAAEDAAAKAKAAADKAAADSLATEESKRNAARNQIAKDRAVSKKIIQKIQGDAQKNTEKINKSAIDIKSAYELALDQLVKVNKSMALLKEKENVALSTLNQTKSELLTASNSLQSATQKQGIAVAKQAEANYATVKIQVEIDSNKKALAENEKSIKVAQTTLNDATKKYEKLNAIAQSATAKATESKRVEEVAYNAWQSSLNATKLTASLTFSDSLPTDNPQTANAQSALSKLKEQYDLARKQYEIEKAFADKAVAEANLAKRVLETAKNNLEIRVSLKATLVIKIDKLTGDLTAAKSILKSATAEKAIAIANYTKSENAYAAIKSKFSQSEITYQSAKADTKYEYENATSQNNQVIALRKLSEFSKNSVKTAKDVLNSIQDEAKKLENSKIVGFLNDNSNLATIPLPVFIIGISVVSIVAIYAYLRRRQRRSKMAVIDREILEQLMQKNLARSKPIAKSKKK